MTAVSTLVTDVVAFVILLMVVTLAIQLFTKGVLDLFAWDSRRVRYVSRVISVIAYAVLIVIFLPRLTGG